MDRKLRYFYIRKDGYLCGGVSRGDGTRMRGIPVWRKPGDFQWARRFTTVENAVKYAECNEMFDVSVVDDTGTVVYVHGRNRLLDTNITGVV